jgi:hypothetical protein
MRQKRPAALNIGVDLDAGVIATFDDDAAADIPPNLTMLPAAPPQMAMRDRLSVPPRRRPCFSPNRTHSPAASLSIATPPYMHETRGRRDLYRFEMDDRQHAALLDIIKALPRDDFRLLDEALRRRLEEMEQRHL